MNNKDINDTKLNNDNMKTQSNKIVFSNLCIIIGILLILSAGGLFAWNELENKTQEENVKSVIEQMHNENEGHELSDWHSVSDTNMDIDLSMPSVVIDGNEYIGYLTFPSLELEVPVMSDWNYDKLKIAPCRYYGSIETKDLVIAGHNYRNIFGKLSKLSTGDEVLFTTMNEVVISYEVCEVIILEPTAIEEMIDSPYDLSLYTCTYGGKQRVTVRLRMKEY